MDCPNCGAANPADASFCGTCGDRLTRDCRSCGASLPPDARFCLACGAPVAEPEPATTAGEERKLVTVLFADVTGSTTLGEQLDPERFRDVLATYFEAMRAEIEAEGGTVEKFIGDAVMAVFGAPQAHEDDPARALRAAQRMLARLDEVNEELVRIHDVALEIRVGVHTGDVLAAIEVVPGEPMVTGDVVNTAARLQIGGSTRPDPCVGPNGPFGARLTMGRTRKPGAERQERSGAGRRHPRPARRGPPRDPRPLRAHGGPRRRDELAAVDVRTNASWNAGRTW